MDVINIMAKRQFVLCIISLFILGSHFSACKKQGDKVDGEASIETGADKPLVEDSTQKPGSPFWVRIETEYEAESENRSLHGECTYPIGAPIKGADINCQIDIPEGQLYFSKMYVTMGASKDNQACEILSFRPYFYRISNQDKYKVDELSSEINCSGSETDADGVTKSIPIPVECYGGPATDLIPNFPYNSARYFTRLEQDAGQFEIKSANSSRFRNNRWAANFFPNRVNYTTGYLNHNIWDGVIDGRSPHFVDYRFTCADKFYEKLYGINLIIKSVPIETDNIQNQDFSAWPRN